MKGSQQPRVTRRAAWLAVGAAMAVSIGGVVGGQAPAGESSTAETPSLRVQGLRLGYNLDHAEALVTFQRAIAADPTDPIAQRLAAATAWSGLLFEQGAITVDDYLGQARANLSRPTPSPALDRVFHDALDQAIRLSEERLKQHPSDADAHYQVGAAYGYLASYTATVEGRLLGSLGPARRAYHEHQRTLALDPGRKDAGLVVGLYRYAVANLPAPMRLMARLAGFGGGRAGAVRMVEEAAAYSSDARPNALFTLALIYNREARYDDALRVLGELQRLFPRNRLLWLEAGSTTLRAGRPAEARAILEDGLARLSRDPRPRAPGEAARWAYADAAVLVALEEHEAAEGQLRIALDGANRDWLRGRVHTELGKLADLAGDRPHALEEYRLAEGLCRRDHDSDCAEAARRLIKTGYR